MVEISRLFGVSTDDLLLAERDLPPAAPPPAGEQAPAARPDRALLVAGVCLAALGGLGDLVLWVLSTMVESDLPATSMDGLGRIRYTTQRGYAFWPFIEEHRLQVVLGLCTLSLLTLSLIHILDNKKRRYAPRRGVAYRLFLWGVSKGGNAPIWHTTLRSKV